VEFRLVVGRGDVPVRLAVPGRHNVTMRSPRRRLLMPSGVGLDRVRAGLEAFQPPGMRMEVTQLPNASPC